MSRTRDWPVLLAALAALVAPDSYAQMAPTPTTTACPVGTGPYPRDGQPFVMPPELVSANGVLRGTVTLTEEFQRMPTSLSGSVTCQPQLVRVFRGEGLPPAPPAQKPDPNLLDPLPGPTLRARVGDLVQLAFVNKVDSNRFDRNLDIDKCMEVGKDGATYPKAVNDAPPNCLHASSTANIHFHGTHTNPNATGDNVYLQVRPLPRDNQGKLTTTPAAASAGFDEFFARCTQFLRNPLNPWPATWRDVPAPWTDKQTELLKAYEAKNPGQPLWTEDQKRLGSGWPIYYIGAVPFCFALPAYTAATWPPPPGSASPIMGQSPGTHWYHAHKHGSTAINVANGMTGAFIIEGRYDDDLNDFYGKYVLGGGKAWNARSQPVMVLNQLGTGLNLLSAGGPAGPRGVDFVVNGRLRPKVAMQPGEVQLWRIVNTSGRNSIYFMAPEGVEWQQLAQDGVQLADANYRASLNKPFFMAPGNRVDLLVKAPMQATTADILTQNVRARSEVKPTPANPTAADPNPGVSLVTVVVAGDPVRAGGVPAQMPFMPRAPQQPVFLQDISNQELSRNAYGSRKLVFHSKGPTAPAQHTINDVQFDSAGAHIDVLLGAVEEWTVQNTTSSATGPGAIDHPFHIHVNPFQITEFFDPNEYLTDPKTGQLERVLENKTSVPVSRYVTDKSRITDARQCLLDPRDPSTWKPCGPAPQQNLVWWDVFAIPSARDVGGGVVVPGYFKMRSRFVDYAGLYVLHCHILVHEDRGMMFSVEVTRPARTPVAHH